MMSRFENLWESAAGDGAWSPVGVARPECEFDALMDAWFRERQDSIECRLYLDEAGRLLREILGEDRCLAAAPAAGEAPAPGDPGRPRIRAGIPADED